MLTVGVIAVSGTIDVSDLVGSSGDVPVRGIHVHVWINDNAVYNNNPADPSRGLNGTGQGGICADAYTNNKGFYSVAISDPDINVQDVIHVVALAESNPKGVSQYRVIQPDPGTHSPPATRTYTSQVDDSINSITNTFGGQA